ncbi:50S ribosomal protein L21 [Natranaerofaba carboxydovora]|uniref:50S ribosomal protein L21 n=1 Tax=Natranaerofaba carboxydovora TaxID=2742683 RepID=UPI001F13F811|nr:50S ribosomal protein L21 [Natranaerofaba carboxydovora]UMZ72880.1 50S ribosomal protein L21 [Natranaerofaba carboxydovora]
MYAIIESGGKQYKVKEGDVINVEKLPEQEEGSEVLFDKVLMVRGEDEEDVKIGAPFVDGVKVKGKIEEHGKGDKVVIFKYKPKKDYRRKKGHRQPYTQVKIDKIEA